MSEYDKLYNRYMQEANAYADSYRIPGTGHNDARDAFRHAYASGAMAREYGVPAAHVFGDLNEIRGDLRNQPWQEKNMDKWNNSVGRDIGKNASSSNEIAQKVNEALKRGDLITDPWNDARRYNGDSWLSDLFDSLADRIGDAVDDLSDWIDQVGDSFADAIRDQLRRLIDPIVLDLDGNGIELIPRATSNVYFDMDGDGIKEQTGWVKPTDGLLAIDSNANGQIDNINELIGDLGRSGFAELVTYDLNNDRVINASDAVWSQFRVWLDANSNGLTDAGELRTLASLNIWTSPIHKY
jgi:hypothetical protein